MGSWALVDSSPAFYQCGGNEMPASPTHGQMTQVQSSWISITVVLIRLALLEMVESASSSLFTCALASHWPFQKLPNSRTVERLLSNELNLTPQLSDFSSVLTSACLTLAWVSF